MINPGTPLWNPTQTLNQINPDRNTQTCIGYAPSQGRRCRNPILAATRSSIAQTLDEISYLHPSNPVVLKKLRSIAGPCLCVRFHKGQAEDVLLQWRRKISQLEVESERKPVRSTKREKSLEQQLREMSELLARMQERLDGQDQGAGDRAEEERKRRENKRKQEKERLEKEKAEQQAKQQRERERHAQNERIRQRAHAKQQENERLAREKERKERQEWDNIWKNYQQRWASFKASPSRDPKDIPWPVRPGQNVEPSTVKEFYEKAAPRDVDFAKCMKRESLKWHPNCPSSMGNLRRLGGEERGWVGEICRVLTGLIDGCAGKEAECLG